MKSGRINKRFALLAILCVLAMVFAVPVASAAGYSKVYGQTQDKIRVRESASTNATIIDNIVKDACVYITSSKVSGSNTFVQVKYRASDGSTETGWVCQSDGKDTYVKILSAEQAKSKFKVSGGNVPSKAVGTFTAAERKASAANSDNTYIRQNASGETVKRIQTELKALNYYSGKITGNAGEKTVAAIKSFQRKNGLTADGIAGPQTIAKIDAAYESKTGKSSSSATSSSASGLKLNSKGTDVRNLQQDLTTLGYYWAEITGNFGAKTETAVKRFQERNGLISDGYLGTATKELLLSDNVQANSIGLGDSGSDVTRIQERLVALGYLRSATGYFGESTVSALKSFQQRNGLSADGKFGASTNHKLFSDSAVKAPVSTPKKNNNSSNKNNSNKNNSGNKNNNSGSSSGGGNYSYSGSGSVSALIAAAESRLGCKYVLGAKGPNQFDCSGLVYWCLNNAGVKQGYMTSAGWRNCGKYQRINSRSEVKAGDILVFRGHVGIAVSNSMMIDASTSKGKVVKRTSYGTYWDTRWICAYRIF